MLLPLPEENASSEESDCSFRNIPFNAVVESADKPDMYQGVTRYLFINPLLRSDMEKVYTRLTFARRWAIFGMGVSMIGPSKNSSTADVGDLYLPVIRGCYLLMGRDSTHQGDQSDVEIHKSRSPGLFVLVSATELISVLVGLAMHTYV